MQNSVPGQSDQVPSHSMTAGEVTSASRQSRVASETQQHNHVGGSRPHGLALDMHHRQAFGNRQSPAEPVPHVTTADESVYADEASLPSFAQMAAAHGQRCSEQTQQSSNGMIYSNR